jgi:hypothetical protein
MADPFRLYGVRRQNDQKPITTSQSFSNFIVLLLRAHNMLRAVPVFDAMTEKRLGESGNKHAILMGVRNEYFAGTRLRKRSHQ